MRRELLVALVASALALFVYAGARTTDARVGTLASTVQAALQANAAQFEPGDDIIFPTESGTLDYLIFLAFLLLLFGGLPVAIFGLVGHREWRRAARERLLFVHVPYAVLLFQIVSVLCSAIWLVVLTPRVVSVLSLGIVDGHDLFLPAYLMAQFLAGIAAIPVWRRHMLNTSAERTCSVVS